MALILHALSLGEALPAFICSADTGPIVIGTLWLGEPNRSNARARRDPIGITIVASVSCALPTAALGS
jgi:hypothetical protein